MGKRSGAKLFLTVGALALSGVLLAGCYPDLEELVPDAYGGWDDNYVYYGNFRSKTTGEDTEILIKRVDLNGTTYDVTDWTDFECVGDDMYICLSVKNPAAPMTAEEADAVEDSGLAESSEEETEAEEEDVEITSCLVRYNIYERATEVVYCGIEPDANGIEVISENSIVLFDYDQSSRERNTFRIDYEGNVLEENSSQYDSASYFGENNKYIVRLENNTFRFKTWEDETFLPVYTTDASFYRVDYICEDGLEGFLIYETEKYYKGLGHAIPNADDYLTRTEMALWFFDAQTRELTQLLSMNEHKIFASDGLYFVTADEAVATTKTRKHPFSSSWSYSGELVYRNCELWKLVKDGEGTVSLESRYAFDEELSEMDFTDFTVAEENIYFSTSYVEKGAGCSTGGYCYRYYRLSIKSGELEKTDEAYEAPYEESNSALKNGQRCGQYIYYIETDEYSGGTAYSLKRYNRYTERTDVMQFWAEYYKDMYPEESSGELNVKFSEKMWFNGGNYSYSPYGFLVRNY